MRFLPFWLITFYQTAKVNAKRSMGKGGRRGGGQFRRTAVRRNVGQRNRPGLFGAQADTARHSFRAARFRPPCTLGFRDVPLRGVREGWMETKGPCDGVGFRKVALRAVREGWMETKGLWDRVGFRERPLRAVREGWMETRGA